MARSTTNVPWKPTNAQLAAASRKKLRDVLASGLDVLFCGINPGLYSAATGHHFARPGNRFWPTLHASGFTPRLFTGFDDRSLLDLNLGITNIAGRTTATADELSPNELRAGGNIVGDRKTRRHAEEGLRRETEGRGGGASAAGIGRTNAPEELRRPR